MKAYSPATLAALDSGEVVVTGALKIALADPFCVWGGYGDLVIAGDSYVGVGQRALVSTSGGQLGTAEQGAELTLSGVDPDLLSLVDLTPVRGAVATLWRLIFDGEGVNLLDASIHLRGRCDRLPRQDTPGGASTLTLGVEGAVRGLGRNSGRLRSDADQRLIDGGDTGFSRVSYAGTKTLYWGGKPPVTASGAFG